MSVWFRRLAPQQRPVIQGPLCSGAPFCGALRDSAVFWKRPVGFQGGSNAFRPSSARASTHRTFQ
eukprot:6526132-Alexandrium_andersonii.AAC.1